MKKVIQSLFNRTGYTIIKTQLLHFNGASDEGTMYKSLKRLYSLNLLPSTIIDVGAAEGTWTEKAQSIWPEAKYMLFEPLYERKEQLEELQKKSEGKIFLSFSAAGKEEAEVNFYVSDDLDGSAVNEKNSFEGDSRKVHVTTIDAQIEKFNLPAPYAIKLDTHGFEVPILEGAIKTLDNSLFVIIECYGFNITPDSLLFHQMCNHMEKYGFRLFDIVDTMRRDKDHAFWQCDAVFIRNTSDVFKSNSYR